MHNNSKSNTVLLVIVILLIVIGIWFVLQKKNAARMDNMMIPTGETQTINNGNGPDYQPNPKPTLSTTLPKYVASQNWPPVIQTSTNVYSCSPGKSTPGVYGSPMVVEKSINGRTYCISTFSDCGAGQCGGDYTYTTANGSGTKTATFNLYWNNSCGGYGGPGDPEYDQCKSDQTYVFSNLDAMVDSLMFLK